MTEHPKEFHIKVDKTPLTIPAINNPISGAALKKLGGVPELGYDLWLRVPGPGNDRPIADNENVQLEEGMHFYSAKSILTPGA